MHGQIDGTIARGPVFLDQPLEALTFMCPACDLGRDCKGMLYEEWRRQRLADFPVLGS